MADLSAADLPARAPLPREALAALRLELGLGADGLALDLNAGALPLDQNPWLGDTCALRVELLGHQDHLPRAWDWDNLLSLLEPGEELLWIVDYLRAAAREGRESVEVHLALRRPGGQLRTPGEAGERRRRFRALANQFARQAFPESRVTILPAERTWRLVQRHAVDPGARTLCVAGMPSPRTYGDEATQVERDTTTRSWQSLNDVVETCLGLGTSFRLVFVVSRLARADLDAEYARVSALRDAVHPFIRGQRQVGTSTGTTNTRQSTTTRQDGGSQKAGDIPWAETVRQWLNLPGWALGRTLSPEVKPTHTWSVASAEGTVAGDTRAETAGYSEEVLRSDLLLAGETLDRYLRSLYDARGTGAFRGAVLVTAPGAASDVIASTVRGVLAGARSKDRPLTTFEIRGEPASLLQSTRPCLELLAPALPILQLDQACHLLLLPEAEVPGLALQRSVFLGRNATPPDGEGPYVTLGHDAFLGASAGIGRREIEVPERDLYRHILVAGTTGSGKTRRVLKILADLATLGDDLRVLVFETAKRTYRDELRRLPAPAPPPRIYTLGDATEYPLRVNPFYFEPGTSLKRHLSVLSDALSELVPTESMIGPYMREAVESAYLACGWDIETGRAAFGREARYPTVVEFVAHVRRVAANLGYGAEVTANYRGALEARARLFLDATFQDIFSGGGERTIDELFDRDTILEMEALPASEIDVPAFLLSLILERLRASQARALAGGRRRGWLVVVEEAHNVLSRDLEGRGDSREANGGRTLLERVVRLLQEGRELRIGVMVVDQAPAMLARGVLKNTNTKIAMRLDDGEEMEEMGRALGLDEERWRDLGVLRQGEAIVKATYMSHPVKSPPYANEELPRPVDPAERAPVAHIAPSYPSLEAAWTAVLDGQGPAPDAAWRDRLLDFAAGDGEIARFGLGRALLRTKDTRGVADVEGRAFGALPTDPDGLLATARRLHARAGTERLGRGLLPLERRILAADLTAALPDRTDDIEVSVLRASAEVLARATVGPGFDRWLDALIDLATAGAGQWPAASARFRASLRALGAKETHTSIRLRCVAARMRHHPVARGGEPLEMQVLARRFVAEILPEGATVEARALAEPMVTILRSAKEDGWT